MLIYAVIKPLYTSCKNIKVNTIAFFLKNIIIIDNFLINLNLIQHNHLEKSFDD
jgi:hypothetical protein